MREHLTDSYGRTIGDLRISVTDNGKGISKEMQEVIFGLFNQGGEEPGEGLGIGLTLAKNLVELHGGTICVASEGDSRGSEFTVRLPIVVGAAEAPPATDNSKSTPDVSSTGPGRILVADDGKNAADILRMFFDLEGYHTRVAYDGAEAFKAAGEFQPDMICMDIGMPKMDGLEVARLIRKNDKNVILVAISGWGTEEDRQRSLDAGFNHHLVKPVKPDELRELLSQYSDKLHRA